jgi:hypothetical protein
MGLIATNMGHGQFLHNSAFNRNHLFAFMMAALFVIICSLFFGYSCAAYAAAFSSFSTVLIVVVFSFLNSMSCIALEKQ